MKLKLKKDNLEKIQNIVNNLSEATRSIGVMETKKLKIIDQALYWESEYEKFKQYVSEKYGEEAKIDMSDGSISGASKKLNPKD